MTQPLRLAAKLLLLLLLSPEVGLAALQDAPEQPSQQTTRLQPREPESTPESFTRAPKELRLVAETGLGALTGLGGLLIGAGLIGPGLCAALGNAQVKGSCLNEAIIGAGAGAMLAAPLGVFSGGMLTGADGDLGSSYLGALVGGAAGGLLLAATWSSSARIVGFLLLPVLPFIGSIIGYELSVSPEPSKVALGGTRLQPLLSISPRGSLVGLGGSF